MLKANDNKGENWPNDGARYRSDLIREREKIENRAGCAEYENESGLESIHCSSYLERPNVDFQMMTIKQLERMTEDGTGGEERVK